MKARRSLHRFFAAFVTSLFISISVPIVFADQEGGNISYTAVTPDGKHIFVMRAGSDPNTPYPASGMYLNDGSTVPLWTVDWNALAFVPSGGEFLVSRRAWARWSGTYREEALTFFANGKPIKTYSHADLIDFPWLLPHSVAHYGFQQAWTPSESTEHPAVTSSGTRYANTSVTFDDTSQTMTTDTVLGDRITFDLRTGEIISATRSRTITTIASFVCLLLVYAAWRFSYPSTALVAPFIQPSNVLVSGLFTLSLVAIPTTVAYFFRTLNPTEGDSYEYFMRLGFETLPRYVVALAGFEKPEITPSGSPLMVGFWLACLATFTIADRVFVFLVDLIRRVR